ncbi:Amiloride-sensitive sodium channel subunit alpha [Lamellibrachia satsuma]|nr:Amiloride-sensitive sodium channel subunit alpha [Lamellibrachia satsuma]
MTDDAVAGDNEVSDAGKKTTPSMWTLMKDKAMETGVQGVPNIGRARHLARKMFWILVVFGGTVLMTWQVTTAVMTYYTYPVKTQTLYQNAGQLVFPAVTICNLNPLREGALLQAGDVLACFKKKSSSFNKTDKPPSFNDWTGQPDYEKETDEFSAMQSYLTLSAQLTPDQRRIIGHQLNKMLLSCTWNGLKCSPKNFTVFSNHLYGNCYTFNADNTNKTLMLSKPGPVYGLSLEMYIEQDQYIPSISDAAGVRVIVHNQTEMPFPEDAGFSVTPGHKTSVALRRVDVIRATPPHGNCVYMDSTQNEQVNAFHGEVSTIGYSAAVSNREHSVRDYKRFAQSQPEVLGCAAVSVPERPEVAESHNRNRFLRTMSCTSPNTSNEGLWLFRREVSVLTLHYSVRGHNEHYQHKALQITLEYCSRKRSNALKVEIYFKELDYQQIVTSPSYEVENLLADLGGQAGLWLGVSVIAFFEFFELLFDVISVAVVRLISMCRLNRERTSPVEPM